MNEEAREFGKYHAAQLMAMLKRAAVVPQKQKQKTRRGGARANSGPRQENYDAAFLENLREAFGTESFTADKAAEALEVCVSIPQKRLPRLTQQGFVTRTRAKGGQNGVAPYTYKVRYD